MSRTRQHYTPEFKFQVVLEVLKEERTVNEIAIAHKLHPNLITRWKSEFLESGAHIERFWRTLKQQEVYLNEYSSPREARNRITAFIEFYNYLRPHQSLNGKTPREIYRGFAPLRLEDIHLTNFKIVS